MQPAIHFVFMVLYLLKAHPGNTEKITVCYAKMTYSKNKTECLITLVGLILKKEQD